jgi:exodeoxyribonuclease V gamma subunit
VGRDDDTLRVLERFDPPAANQAAELLAQLREWREQHRSICWPLPPETGWAFAAFEQSGPGQGSGWRKAREAWEGGFNGGGERREAVQALCFGSDLPLAELLTPQSQQLALALHTPLLERRQEVKR